MKLPESFTERMRAMLGDEFDAFLASYEEEPRQALRLNALKKNKSAGSAVDLFAAGPEENKAAEITGFHLSPVAWAENGYYYDSAAAPGKHPYHEAGVYYIQEPSAMAPVGLLDVQPGDRVLDLCAAPGGKSTQIAALLQGKGLLVTNEIHPARAKILSENIERMGVMNACVTNESSEKLATVFPVFFDKILVDAPCSGEGMFRKNHDAVAEWSPENVALCAERQQDILDQAAIMLSPGGRMVYSTCTFAPAENEEGIARFLDRHPEFTLVEQKRLWPHKIEGEGHFEALLVKSGEMSAERPKNREKSLGAKELTEWYAFAAEALNCPIEEVLEGRFLKFGDNLYLTPTDMPSLKGLKVLRPGLQLGTVKKERFEPAHSLALALDPSLAKHTWNLSTSERMGRAYIAGEGFAADGEKGWYLVLLDGFSLGWGKLAGGMMKNHYPKGLRKNL